MSLVPLYVKQFAVNAARAKLNTRALLRCPEMQQQWRRRHGNQDHAFLSTICTLSIFSHAVRNHQNFRFLLLLALFARLPSAAPFVLSILPAPLPAGGSPLLCRPLLDYREVQANGRNSCVGLSWLGAVIMTVLHSLISITHIPQRARNFSHCRKRCQNFITFDDVPLTI